MSGYWCPDCKEWIPLNLRPHEYVTQARSRVQRDHETQCPASLWQHPELALMDQALEEWYPT